MELKRPVPRQVLPGWSRAPHDYELAGRWTPNGEFFVFAAVHDGTPGLFAIRERRAFFDMGTPAPIRLTDSPEGVSSPVPSPDGKKIYAIVNNSLRGELTRLEPKSGQPAVWPGMPGLSAGHVAFSPDGHEAAYVTYPEMNLWKMKVGTERRQLTFDASKAAMPQWSPDGRRIAFMGWDGDENRPTKIRIISAEGGPPEQPVTCSAKTPSLILSRHPVPSTGSTSRPARPPTFPVPPAYSKVGDNPAWSKDGKFVYIDAPLASDPAIYRIHIADSTWSASPASKASSAPIWITGSVSRRMARHWSRAGCKAPRSTPGIGLFRRAIPSWLSKTSQT
jgi:hypothetical protein